VALAGDRVLCHPVSLPPPPTPSPFHPFSLSPRYKDGQLVPGESGPSLQIVATAAGTYGEYRCVVVDKATKADLSDEVRLVVDHGAAEDGSDGSRSLGEESAGEPDRLVLVAELSTTLPVSRLLYQWCVWGFLSCACGASCPVRVGPLVLCVWGLLSCACGASCPEHASGTPRTSLRDVRHPTLSLLTPATSHGCSPGWSLVWHGGLLSWAGLRMGVPSLVPPPLAWKCLCPSPTAMASTAVQ
jgi:hypothetical protein